MNRSGRAGACVTLSTEGPKGPAITSERAAHFLAPDDTDVLRPGVMGFKRRREVITVFSDLASMCCLSFFFTHVKDRRAQTNEKRAYGHPSKD